MMKSRSYWSREAYLSAGRPGVRKGPAGTLECLVGRRNAGPASGWALAIPMVYWEGGGWVVPSHVPTHPYQVPVHPSCTPPPVHVRHAGTDCLDMRFGLDQGDPRG